MSNCTNLLLSRNSLTGHTKELLGAIGLLFVEYLYLGQTSLNKDDLLQIAGSIESGKLPKLEKIYFTLRGVEATIFQKSGHTKLK